MEKDLLLQNIMHFSKESLENCIKHNTAILTAFLKDLSKVTNPLLMNDFTRSPADIWLDSLIDICKVLHLQLSEKSKDVNDLFDQPAWQSVEKNFTDFMAQWSEETDLPYEHKDAVFFEKYSDKRLKLLFYRFKSKSYMKKTKKTEEHISGRTFSLNDFLNNHLYLPLAKQTFEENQHFLFALSGMLNMLHNSTEQFNDTILLVDKFNADSSYWALLKTQDIAEKITTYQADFAKAKSVIQVYKKNALKRSNAFNEDLIIQISDMWDIAGSPLLKAGKFSRRLFASKNKKLTERSGKASKKWQIHLDGEREDWSKDQEMSHLQFLIAKLYLQTLDFVNQIILKKVEPTFAEIKSAILNTLAKFKSDNEISEKDLRKVIDIESRDLIRSLRQNKLPALHDFLTKARFNEIYGGFLVKIKKVVANLNEDHSIFTKLDLQNIPPQSELDDVPLKELIEGEIISIAEKKDLLISNSLNEKMQSLLRGISNLDQIVEFNLEAAHNLLNEKDKAETLAEAKKIAIEGLERALANVEDLQNSFSQSIDSANSAFDLMARQVESDLQKLGDNEKILALKIRLARAKTREKILQLRKDIWKKIKQLLPKIALWLKNQFSKLKNEYLRLRKVSGLGPQVAKSGDILTDFLVNTERDIKKMPYVYQRLFRLEPLEEMRFFYGRTSQLQYFGDDIQQFDEGIYSATAIIGEKGSGKTTLLKFAEKEYFSGHKIIKIDLTDTIYSESEFTTVLANGFNFTGIKSLEEFEAKLNSEDGKIICVLENIHNLFLRVIDGFSVVERLLLLISRTRYNVFWIVTCGLYAWQYFDKVLNVSDFFRRAIVLKSMAVKDVYEIIMNRHLVSGYGLQYVAPEKVLTSRIYKKLKTEEKQQEYLQDLLFEKLTDISGGNIKSAILFWLSVLNTFDDDKITVSEEIALESSAFYQLSAADLFSLAAFIQHEYLNDEQHALILRLELSESRLILNRLYKKGYLTRTANKYFVHPLLYKPVIKILKLKNILL